MDVSGAVGVIFWAMMEKEEWLQANILLENLWAAHVLALWGRQDQTNVLFVIL